MPNNFLTLLKEQKPMPKTIAFVTRNDFFPRAVTRMVRKAAKKQGFTDVYYAEFPKDSKDMSTWLTIVKGKNPTCSWWLAIFPTPFSPPSRRTSWE